MTTYEIVVEGRVQGSLMWALEGFEVISGDGGETRLRGEVADPPALRDLFRRISGCNLRLTSLERVDDTRGHDGGERQA